MIIWGGSWVSAKAIADTLPPETLVFWRLFITSISFIPILFFLKEPLKISKSALFYTILGSLSLGLYLYLFFKGLIFGFAGAAGVLVTTMIPLSTFLLSIFFFNRKVSAKDFVGLILGITGGCILLKIWTINGDNIFMTGNIYFLFCAVFWALLTIFSQKAGNLVSPLIFSLLVNAFCSALFFFIALPHGILTVFEQGSLFWLNMIYLSVISSTFATTVYFFASSRLSSFRASSFVFMVPSSAVALSWYFLDEQPRASTITGGLIAISAVYLINIRG
jgi:drug/metabolite transporter (DMT)-like permease